LIQEAIVAKRERERIEEQARSRKQKAKRR